ncbi:MAG TPA: agmatinase [Candidatus Limnocylindrales bacterium]|nr:agmatinase [Candidatus Limnocylindrales bacterium]
MKNNRSNEKSHSTGFQGKKAAEKEKQLSTRRYQEWIDQALAFGLPAAESVQDRTISCFARRDLPPFAGINTFLKAPYLEDVRKVSGHDVGIIGVPLDTGTTYRSGTRFGPQAIRRISALYLTYSFELGVDLREQLDLVDLGDVFVIPGNLEKSFDQITKAVSFVSGNGVFPVVLGGDHSIGFATVRGIAQHVEGNVGIIHFDRHIDTEEKDMDERMHTCPWFHATQLPNVKPQNLVQIGIGGWQVRRGGIQVARERGTTILTVQDVEELGIERAAEIALEIAWKGAKAVYLSFDIDSIDPAYAPGTGWPEPGGFTPREASKLLTLIAQEGLCGMEVVEVSPPYDVSDLTALMALRVICDTLGTLVDKGYLPKRRGS